MANAIENARKRLSALRNQVAEIERFLEMYEAFDAGTDADRGELRANPASAPLSGNIPTESNSLVVDKSVEKRRRRGPRPAEIVQILERVIREAGRPLTRGEIVEALEHRDVEISAEDKHRYIGTIAWRNKSIFKNIEGLGYWLTGEPLPMAMGLPLDDEPPRRQTG